MDSDNLTTVDNEEAKGDRSSLLEEDLTKQEIRQRKRDKKLEDYTIAE